MATSQLRHTRVRHKRKGCVVALAVVSMAIAAVKWTMRLTLTFMRINTPQPIANHSSSLQRGLQLRLRS